MLRAGLDVDVVERRALERTGIVCGHRKSGLILWQNRPMDKRALGPTGISVSSICFGGNVLGWTCDEPTSFAVLDAYAAAGGDFIDTADVYSRWAPGHVGGESEVVLGRWMRARGNRKRMIVATKLGNPMGDGPEDKGLAGPRVAAGGRGFPAPASRPTTSTSTRPTSTTRRRPWTRRCVPSTRWSSRARPARSAPRTTAAKRFGEALDASRKLGVAAYATLQPCLQPRGARRLRGGAGAPLPRARDRGHPLLLARRRLPHRQVPPGRGAAAARRERAGHQQALHARPRLGGAQRGGRRERSGSARPRGRSRWPGCSRGPASPPPSPARPRWRR